MSPGRILPDSSIVEAARLLPKTRKELLAIKTFRGRGAERYADEWVEAVQIALALPEADLPPVSVPYDGPPPARIWKDRNPVAAARLSAAREALAELSHEVSTPVENLLTPDYLRRLLWEPPETSGDLVGEVAARLLGLGARPWQVELTGDLITKAILDAADES